MIIEEKKAGEFNCCQRTRQTHKPCEGYRCMAWRWVFEEYVTDDHLVTYEEKTHGYCGLAGRP